MSNRWSHERDKRYQLIAGVTVTAFKSILACEHFFDHIQIIILLSAYQAFCAKMATIAQCIYCFESLAASLEKRTGLTLPEVEDLWAKYDAALEQPEETNQLDGEAVERSGKLLQSPAMSRLQVQSPASGSSASSTPSQNSASSSTSAFSNNTVSSSKTSLFSFDGNTPKEEEHPVYITWNILSSKGHKSLRGCIGTFEPQPLSEGLREYALISWVRSNLLELAKPTDALR